jgi:hypothetical protein
MADPVPSTFSLWLEEALSSWILPVAGLALVGVVGGLYTAGYLGEELTASLVVLAAAVAVALFCVRAALDRRRDGSVRALAFGAAALSLASVAVPALRSVNPGDPLFAGDVGMVDDTVAIPEGVTGRVHVLVSGRLPDRGEPQVTFTLTGTEPPLEGHLERTIGTARVGRSGRARVAQDHTADYYAARLAPGARALKLERLSGELGSRLHVSVFRDPIPVPGGPWVLAALALLLACLADARMGKANHLAVAVGMAVAFGLLVTYHATPASAVGPAVGGVVLGALLGALGGWIVGAIVRRLVPPAPKRAAPRANGAAAA